MQLYADIYLLLNYCTCFGRLSCPSSGVHVTVVADCGTDHTILGASFLKSDQIMTVPEAATTVLCTLTVLCTIWLSLSLSKELMLNYSK